MGAPCKKVVLASNCFSALVTYRTNADTAASDQMKKNLTESSMLEDCVCHMNPACENRFAPTPRFSKQKRLVGYRTAKSTILKGSVISFLLCVVLLSPSPEALFAYGASHSNNSVQLCSWLASAVYDYQESHTPVSDSVLMGQTETNAEAENACRQALIDDPENPQIEFKLARVLILSGRSSEGEQLAKKAAKSGYTAAMFLIGKAYYQGWLGRPDFSKAVEWLSEAANKGHQDAQLMLGTLYRYGHGVKVDLKKAYELLSEAAAQGNSRAQYLLGMMYYEGVFVDQSASIAFSLIKNSADQGVTHAQFTAGLMYLHGNGTTKDPTAGLDLLEKAAISGYSLAQIQLGDIYFEGKLVESDKSRSRDYFCRAGALGKERYFDITREELNCPN